MSPRAPTLIAAAGLGAVASAQTLSFEYSFQGVPATMSQGQTATIMVRCWYSPGFGGSVSTPSGPGNAIGLSAGSFDLIGTAGAWTLGNPPTGSLFAPFNFPGTSQGTASGGSVIGVRWGSLPLIVDPLTINPVPLWFATFTAPTAIGAVTLTLDPLGPHGVWAVLPGQWPVEVTSNAVSGAQAVIQIVPSPGGVALLALGGMIVFGSRFRRRRHAPAHPHAGGAPANDNGASP